MKVPRRSRLNWRKARQDQGSWTVRRISLSWVPPRHSKDVRPLEVHRNYVIRAHRLPPAPTKDEVTPPSFCITHTDPYPCPMRSFWRMRYGTAGNTPETKIASNGRLLKSPHPIMVPRNNPTGVPTKPISPIGVRHASHPNRIHAGKKTAIPPDSSDIPTSQAIASHRVSRFALSCSVSNSRDSWSLILRHRA